MPRFDLSRIVRRSGRRGRAVIVLRPIEASHTLEREAAKIGLDILDEWREIALNALPIYENSLRKARPPTYDDVPQGTSRHLGVPTRDAAGDDLATYLDSEYQRMSQLILTVDPALNRWSVRVEEWQRRRFAAIVRSGTGADIFPFLSMADVEDQLAAALERHAGLIRGLSGEMQKRVSETVWREFLNQTPRRTIGKMLGDELLIGRRRANFIASDQTNKLSAELTRVRQEEAGIEKFKWVTAHDERVRPEHAALDGKIFRWDQPPSIGLPGTPPRCRCVGAAYIELLDEVVG